MVPNQTAKPLRLKPCVYQYADELLPMYKSGTFQLRFRMIQKSEMYIPIRGDMKRPKALRTLVKVPAELT